MRELLRTRTLCSHDAHRNSAIEKDRNQSLILFGASCWRWFIGKAMVRADETRVVGF
jgi:hypothetical protein